MLHLRMMEHASCAACGADDAALLFTTPDTGNPASAERFPVGRCRGCGLFGVETNPEAAAQARANRIAVFHGPADRADFPDGHFHASVGTRIAPVGTLARVVHTRPLEWVVKSAIILADLLRRGEVAERTA